MKLAIVMHNIRSVYNVGAILRTADGLGVERVFMSGYTPYPTQVEDSRPPHVRQAMDRQLHKTALGAETSIANEFAPDILVLLKNLRLKGYQIVGLEQDKHSTPLGRFKPARQRVALLLGEEVHGIEPNLRKACDELLEIPMRGHKESFNVSVAAAIAIYELSK